MRPALAALAAVIVLGGCGGSDDTSAPSARQDPPAITHEEQAPPRQAHSPAYTDSKDLCSATTPRALAGEYGGSAGDPSSVAAAYAKKSYGPQFQSDATAGCLAGLP